MSLHSYSLTRRELSCTDCSTCEAKEKKAPRTAATTAAETTGRVGTGCARFYFRRYDNNEVVLVPMQAYPRRSALGNTWVIKHSPVKHARSITVHHRGPARYSASQRGTASLVS